MKPNSDYPWGTNHGFDSNVVAHTTHHTAGSISSGAVPHHQVQLLTADVSTWPGSLGVAPQKKWAECHVLALLSAALHQLYTLKDVFRRRHTHASSLQTTQHNGRWPGSSDTKCIFVVYFCALRFFFHDQFHRIYRVILNKHRKITASDAQDASFVKHFRFVCGIHPVKIAQKVFGKVRTFQ